MPDRASTPTQPRSTARATKASQSSPAATVTIAPPHIGPAASSTSAADPGRRDLDDGAVEALVGHDEVAATRHQQHRVARLVGRAHGVDELGLGLRAHPAARPGRRAGAWCAARAARPSQEARTTALGIPSTFSPWQVTVSLIVVVPSSPVLASPANSISAAPSAGTSDRVGELAAEARPPRRRGTSSPPRAPPAPSCTCRARSRRAARRCGRPARPGGSGCGRRPPPRSATRSARVTRVGPGLEGSCVGPPVHQGRRRRADERAVGVVTSLRGADDVVAARSAAATPRSVAR